jgi:hypothetical protein
VLLLLQVLPEEGGCPYRIAIPHITRVAVDNGIDERINDAPHRAGPARAGAIQETGGQMEGAARREAASPTINCSTTDMQTFGDFGHPFSLAQPQQRLGSAQLPSILCLYGKGFQDTLLLRAQGDESHHCTSFFLGRDDDSVYL